MKNVQIVKLDFNEDFNFSSSCVYQTTFNEEEVLLLEYQKYEGPITLQYLENGGVQSLFHGHLIIKMNNGFLDVIKLKFKDQILTSNEFINMFNETGLINHFFH